MSIAAVSREVFVQAPNTGPLPVVVIPILVTESPFSGEYGNCMPMQRRPCPVDCHPDVGAPAFRYWAELLRSGVAIIAGDRNAISRGIDDRKARCTFDMPIVCTPSFMAEFGGLGRHEGFFFVH